MAYESINLSDLKEIAAKSSIDPELSSWRKAADSDKSKAIVVFESTEGVRCQSRASSIRAALRRHNKGDDYVVAVRGTKVYFYANTL